MEGASGDDLTQPLAKTGSPDAGDTDTTTHNKEVMFMLSMTLSVCFFYVLGKDLKFMSLEINII